MGNPWDQWRRGLWVAAIALAVGALLAAKIPDAGYILALAFALLAALAAIFVTSQERHYIAARLDGDGDPVSRLVFLADRVFEPLPDPVMLLDEGGRALFANKAMRLALGTDAERKHVSALLRTPTVLEAIDRANKTGQAETLEFTFRVPVERHYEAYIARADLKPFVTVVVLHDLTAAKKAEQMRADFVANASHELRTPLAAVSGFIDTLRGHAKDDPTARERFLDIMSVEAGRMRRLIEDLLSLTRIELNEHLRPSTRLRLDDIVRDAAAALSPLAQADNITIDIAKADEIPPILGERDELIQLFQNLLHNAIKYGRENGTVRVTFGLTPPRGGRIADRQAFAAIRDDGEGIPPAAIPRLTERFYRVDVKRSRERGGTGLGLAIVKHILNRHQGRLQVESKVGEGSTFTVFLPVASQAAPAAVTEVL
jgi:two-component system phosphate regulon sensor histidine kinase PhoR